MSNFTRKFGPLLRRRLVTAFSIRSRRKKADQIVAFMREREVKTALLTGAVGSFTLRNAGIVEQAVVDAAESATVCDVEDKPCPWPLVIADGRDLPFGDKEYDLVLANAVIEHVGGKGDQQRFVDEHVRVAKHWVITTPNRWFPVEAHTATAFLHYSSRWRARQDSFTRLLSRREFRTLLPPSARIVGRPWAATFTAFSD